MWMTLGVLVGFWLGMAVHWAMSLMKPRVNPGISRAKQEES